jgi:hypothetical protein
MQTGTEYLASTERAVRGLFEGIQSYTAILRRAPLPVFSGMFPGEEARRTAFDTWLNENDEEIRLSMKAQRDFSSESFALATLCGCVLQVAAMGIQCFSRNAAVPADWMETIRPSTSAVPFCVGRRVRGVPVGLIVYAGRNQFAHLNDSELREPNRTVFERLARNHGYRSETPVLDPAFDLRNAQLVNYASNITSLIGWRSYDAYFQDMVGIVGV